MSADSLTIETKIMDARIGSQWELPAYKTAGAAGMDLRACINEDTPIAPQQTLFVGSGIAISIRDPRYVAIVAPRSGLGVKHGIVLANTIGVIDSDYQDEIRIALFNRSSETYTLTPGERVCQLLILPVQQATLNIVSEFSATTARALGGFGSTGKT